MSNIVPAFATRQFTLTAGQAIAVWGQGAFKVTQVGNYVNAPPAPTVLSDSPAGSLQYQSSTFTNGAVIDVDAYGGLPCFVEQGTAATVKQGRMQNGINAAAVSINATATATVTEWLNGRIYSTSAVATDITVPTGTLLYAASTWAIGEYVDLEVFNSGPNLVQVLPGTDHTVKGGAGTSVIAVPTLTSVIVRTTLVSLSGAVGTFETIAMARPVS